MNSQKSFTLIEFIMVIAIIVVIAAVSAGLVTYFTQNSIFIPNKLNTNLAASQIMGSIVEGDVDVKGGLRFSKSITAAQNYILSFHSQNNLNVTYSLNTSTAKLYRSIGGGANTIYPYYLSNIGVNMYGKNGQMFTYYDANENVTAAAANISRIKIGFIVNSGSGSYTDWQGQADVTSSIAVDRYE